MTLVWIEVDLVTREPFAYFAVELVAEDALVLKESRKLIKEVREEE